MVEERLFVGTAEAEHVEMYIKAIWHINEESQPVRVSTIARKLHVRQPSVIQMLKKLKRMKLANYSKVDVSLTTEGEKIGTKVVRNSRLMEVLMDSALNIEIDEELVCGVEHHMNPQFTDALCTLLKHPRVSPHGKDIPFGQCCHNALEHSSDTNAETSSAVPSTNQKV